MRGYRYAVHWVAVNDEPEEMDAEVVSDFISVQLLADLFDKSPLRVALDVIRYRER